MLEYTQQGAHKCAKSRDITGCVLAHKIVSTETLTCSFFAKLLAEIKVWAPKHLTCDDNLCEQRQGQNDNGKSSGGWESTQSPALWAGQIHSSFLLPAVLVAAYHF